MPEALAAAVLVAAAVVVARVAADQAAEGGCTQAADFRRRLAAAADLVVDQAAGARVVWSADQVADLAQVAHEVPSADRVALVDRLDRPADCLLVGAQDPVVLAELDPAASLPEVDVHHRANSTTFSIFRAADPAAS